MSIHGLPVVYVLNINLISKTIINDLTLDINLVNSVITLNFSEENNISCLEKYIRTGKRLHFLFVYIYEIWVLFMLK